MLVFCVLLFEKRPFWSAVLFIFAMLILVCMLLYFFRLAPRLAQDLPVKVSGLQGRDSDIMSYIATYLLPFVVFPLDSWEQIVALGIVIFVIGYVYVNSNMLHINPMLNLAGFHLYEVTLEGKKDHFSLISRGRIALGATLEVIDLNSGMLLEKELKRNDTKKA